jgi:hypothetical protein
MVYIGIPWCTMNTTTIKIQTDTKSQIDQFREYKNESYDEVIKKLIFIVNNLEKEPELSKETIKAIEAARERIKKGKFVTEDVAKQRLGL